MSEDQLVQQKPGGTDQAAEDETEKVLAKYDRELRYRQIPGVYTWFIAIFAAAFSIFQLYTAIFGVLAAQLQRSIHLGFALGLIFLLFPATAKGNRKRLPVWDLILAVLGVFVGLYWVINIQELVLRAGAYTTFDLIVGGVAILLVLEASRRVVGIPITVIASLFLLYAYFGRYIPGFLHFRGVSVERIIGHMYFTTDGILGTPIGVSATFIFLFLLFGAFLVKTGVGQYFNELALVIAGRRIGGPAKVAVFSSALQGTISGSSVANVVTSGSFTIPMMKKLGYHKNFAGAVEAAASTGGQIMPPIMGAAAFLMAEFIGTDYWQIAKSAFIPALLYFTGIWMMVHFEAKRIGLRGLTKEEMPDTKAVLKKIYLLLPIIAIILFLVMGMTATKAALWGIVTVVLVGAIRKETRMAPKDIFDALVIGARSALGVAAATAAAGIIVGVITLTGLGLKFANGLIELSGGLLIPTLILTMIASIILGMGSPTTANYIITSTIAAPVLIQMGIPALSAHMFTFYFGIVADITPPVALAAFAATGISGGEPIRTGINATRIAIAAFIIPYIFVLSPSLLLVNTTWIQTISVIISSLIGMLGVGVGMIGYWYRQMHILERLIAIGGGLALITPGIRTDLIGIAVLIGLAILQFLIKGKKTAV
jgi:TRAP transporter 4TM/12TM fusion protein